MLDPSPAGAFSHFSALLWKNKVAVQKSGNTHERRNES